MHLSSAATKHCKLLKFLISTIIMEQFCTLGPEKQMQMAYEVYCLLFVVPGDQKWLQKSDCYWVFWPGQLYQWEEKELWNQGHFDSDKQEHPLRLHWFPAHLCNASRWSSIVSVLNLVATLNVLLQWLWYSNQKTHWLTEAWLYTTKRTKRN